MGGPLIRTQLTTLTRLSYAEKEKSIIIENLKPCDWSQFWNAVAATIRKSTPSYFVCAFT